MFVSIGGDQKRGQRRGRRGKVKKEKTSRFIYENLSGTSALLAKAARI